MREAKDVLTVDSLRVFLCKCVEKDGARYLPPENGGRCLIRDDRDASDHLILWAQEGNLTRKIGLRGVHFCPVCGEGITEDHLVAGRFAPAAAREHMLSGVAAAIKTEGFPRLAAWSPPETKEL